MYKQKENDNTLKVDAADPLAKSSRSGYGSQGIPLTESVYLKNSTISDVDNILKGTGPKPTEKAEALESYEKDKGANSLSAWLLSFSLPSAWKSLSQSKCKLWDNRELDCFEGIKFFSFMLG